MQNRHPLEEIFFFLDCFQQLENTLGHTVPSLRSSFRVCTQCLKTERVGSWSCGRRRCGGQGSPSLHLTVLIANTWIRLLIIQHLVGTSFFTPPEIFSSQCVCPFLSQINIYMVGLNFQLGDFSLLICSFLNFPSIYLIWIIFYVFILSS